MVRNRLITVLTINDGILFRTRNFIPDYRYTSNFIDAWSIDEIIILDITRKRSNDKENFYNTVEKFAINCFVPLAVGGGVSSVEDVSRLLNLGADKVTINSQAFEQPELVTAAARKYGSQCVVVSIDAKKIMIINTKYLRNLVQNPQASVQQIGPKKLKSLEPAK